jgi:ribosomal protein L10
MALTRASKTEKVGKLAAELEHSTSAIIGTFKGLTASKDFELRKTVRAAGGSYHVVKNKLAARASEGTKIETALQGLKGVSSVAYTSGDPVALAKALSAWVKDNAEFTFKLGIIDGKLISVDEIGDLATMPGKEELFSKLLFLIQSPHSVSPQSSTPRAAISPLSSIRASRRASLLAQPPRRKHRLPKLPLLRFPPLKPPLPKLLQPKHQQPKASSLPKLTQSRLPERMPRRHSRKTPPHRRVGKPRPRIRSRDNKFRLVSPGAPVWAQRKPWKT